MTQEEIARAFHAEVHDRRKRQWRVPRTDWVEVYDPQSRHWRRCRKSELGFLENQEPRPVRHVKPEAGMRECGEDRALLKQMLSRRLEDEQITFVPGFGWLCASVDPSIGPASDGDIRRELMGAWLGGLATYTHYATWTFSRPVGVAGAMDWGRRHIEWLARWDVDNESGGGVAECPRDERARQRAARKRLQAFLAVERGETGGLLHLHALVAKIHHLQAFCGMYLPPGVWGVKCCMVHAWPCGIARVEPYDPALGAKHYVSKYVIKGWLAEWALLGRFQCSGKACCHSLH